jgi:hypothetical protein
MMGWFVLRRRRWRKAPEVVRERGDRLWAIGGKEVGKLGTAPYFFNVGNGRDRSLRVMGNRLWAIGVMVTIRRAHGDIARRTTRYKLKDTSTRSDMINTQDS